MELIFTNGPGGVCPVQAEGTIDGYPFYFRSRGESWSLRVASAKDADPLDADGVYVWVVTEDYPVKYKDEDGHHRFTAGYATKDECIAFIERHAETFAKTLL